MSINWKHNPRPAQRTGDALSRDIVRVAHLDEQFAEAGFAFAAGGPLDAPNEIVIGGVVCQTRAITGYCAFVYREAA